MNTVHIVNHGVGNGVHTGLAKSKQMCASLPPNSKKDFQDRNMADLASTEKIAREVAYAIMFHITNVRTAKVKPRHSKYTNTMERTVDELSEKHKIFLTSAVNKLEVTEESARSTIDNVANEMFMDHQFNWGRLVTLYAFCGRMAKYLAESYVENKCDLVDKIADYTADYVADTLSSCIQQHGGWDAFLDFFPEPVDMENTIWKGLIYTVMGLGALATMVVVR